MRACLPVGPPKTTNQQTFISKYKQLVLFFEFDLLTVSICALRAHFSYLQIFLAEFTFFLCALIFHNFQLRHDVLKLCLLPLYLFENFVRFNTRDRKALYEIRFTERKKVSRVAQLKVIFTLCHVEFALYKMHRQRHVIFTVK